MLFKGSKRLIKSTCSVWLICELTIKSFTSHIVWLKIFLNWVQIFSSLWVIRFLRNEYSLKDFGVLFSCYLLLSVYEIVYACMFFLPLLLLKVRAFSFSYVSFVSLIWFFKKGDGYILLILITTVLQFIFKYIM